MRPKPLVLIILDGWGHREPADDNAISLANTPHWDQFIQDYPHRLIEGSGEAVGLPDGQMGNSEVGHLNLGAGRIVYQDFTRITQDIKRGTFYDNAVLKQAIETAKRKQVTLHVMGLLSPGGVHSHEDHIFALIEWALKEQCPTVQLHAFLDGRDTPPRSAQPSIERFEKLLSVPNGHFASICGRYYAMDRDQRWDRIQAAYELLTRNKADFQQDTASAALQAAYDRDESDEFVKPTVIGSPKPIQNGDVVVFMNFRADRARQLSRALVDINATGLSSEPITLDHLVCLTEYADDIACQCAYPPSTLDNVLGSWLSEHGLTQLRIAETEKYAHVTFFFNGGIETPFTGEDRILIPSPHVATYDLQPEMSAPELTQQLVDDITAQKHDVIICNFANPDMVGHTGNLPATIKAIETIDQCLGEIHAALQSVGGEALITADHGNAEQMADPSTGQQHTAHTHKPVPLLYLGSQGVFNDTVDGKLSDLAPTMLTLLGLSIPEQMTGTPLITHQQR